MPPRHQIDRLPSDLRTSIDRYLGKENRSVDEFTTFLAELLAPHEISVSRSSAHRYMVSKEESAEILRQTREMTAALAQEMSDSKQQGQLGRMLVEMARSLVHDMLVTYHRKGETPDPKELAMIGKGLAEMARAARLDQDFEKRVEDERKTIEAEANRKAADSMEKVATEAGLSAERVAQIRRDFLGVRENG